MKTADLIPLLLLELNSGDKYGFELTKEIEIKSAGKIVIKQPTLYTVLKKLEKSKFISSYWQDSEIGGKRHYYKLTENGKLQLSTFPSYEELVNRIIISEDLQENELENLSSNERIQSKHEFSIMDQLLETKEIRETVLPTNEVFSSNNVDNSTALDINLTNTECLKKDAVNNDEQFATNEKVVKFAEKVPLTEKIDTLIRFESSTPISLNFPISEPKSETKYVDYVDFKNSAEYKNAKKISKKLLFQSIFTSCSILFMCLLCTLITNFTGHSALYYTFFITALLIALFYPILVGNNLQKLRIKYKKVSYESNTKLKIYIGISALLSVLILTMIFDLCSLNLSILETFKWNNFENLYAPILITSSIFLDILFNYILLGKIKK